MKFLDQVNDPSDLKKLDIDTTNIIKIPELPEELNLLYFADSKIIQLPRYLLTKLSKISWNYNLTFITYSNGYKYSEYILELVSINLEKHKKELCKQFLHDCEEELISRACTPERYLNWTDDLEYISNLS